MSCLTASWSWFQSSAVIRSPGLRWMYSFGCSVIVKPPLDGGAAARAVRPSGTIAGDGDVNPRRFGLEDADWAGLEQGLDQRRERLLARTKHPPDQRDLPRVLEAGSLVADRDVEIGRAGSAHAHRDVVAPVADLM